MNDSVRTSLTSSAVRGLPSSACRSGAGGRAERKPRPREGASCPGRFHSVISRPEHAAYRQIPVKTAAYNNVETPAHQVHDLGALL
eukprot:COSAG01_NODE_34735_length_542_cov_130.803612_1_plen_85_part_10